MGIFGSIIRLGMDLVETPIAITKDVFTAGGALTDQDEPYTVKKLKDIQKDWDKTKDEIDS